MGSSLSRALACALVTLSLCATATVEAQQSSAAEPAEAPARPPVLLPLGSLRVAMGGSGYVSPSTAFNFDFDVTGGFRLGVEVGDGLWITPLAEAGYTYHAGDATQGTGDYFTAAAGLSIGTPIVAATVLPTYLVGVAAGSVVHGYRTALRLDLLLGTWSVEIGHEWRAIGAVDAHAVRVMIGLDLGIVLSWALHLSTGPRRPEPEPR